MAKDGQGLLGRLASLVDVGWLRQARELRVAKQCLLAEVEEVTEALLNRVFGLLLGQPGLVGRE